MKKHKVKKRYIFLLAAIVCIVAGFFIYAVNIGQSYSCIVITGYGEIDMSTVKATSSDESVLKVKSVSQDKRAEDDFYYLKIDLESAGSGECTLDISASFLTEGFDELEAEPRLFRVLPFGTIYDVSQKNFSAAWLIIPLSLVIILLIVIVLSFTFVQKLLRGEFSYSMAGMGGVILFLVMLFIMIISNLSSLTGDGLLNSVNDIILELLLSGSWFLDITNVPMLLLSAALAVSNIWLIVKEGFRIQNALGILIGVLLVGSMYIVDKSNSYNSAASDFELYSQIIINLTVTFLACYLECMFISTIFCAVASTIYRPKKDMDYIIILGCAIRKDGTPTPLLRGRVQRAFDFEKKQFETTGKHAKFVPSGGQGSDEVISEAESMKRCLIELGAPEENIIKEDKSVNTYQNMAFSKKLIYQDAGSPDDVKIGFSTTNYHVFRGYTLANKVDMKAKALSAKTKLYFFPNAFVREFIGLLWEKKLYHLIFATLLVGAMVFFAFSMIM